LEDFSMPRWTATPTITKLRAVFLALFQPFLAASDAGRFLLTCMSAAFLPVPLWVTRFFTWERDEKR
jgi:hypothetical protein